MCDFYLFYIKRQFMLVFWITFSCPKMWLANVWTIHLSLCWIASLWSIFLYLIQCLLVAGSFPWDVEHIPKDQCGDILQWTHHQHKELTTQSMYMKTGYREIACYHTGEEGAWACAWGWVVQLDIDRITSKPSLDSGIQHFIKGWSFSSNL